MAFHGWPRLFVADPSAFDPDTLSLRPGAVIATELTPVQQLEELSADLDAAHGVPVVSCGVLGHTPDCECATL